jgi:hypothetical protein
MVVVRVSMAATGTTVDGGRVVAGASVVVAGMEAVVVVVTAVIAPDIELDIADTRLLELLALQRK